MKAWLSTFVLVGLLCSACAHGQPRQIDEYHWQGIERVVAIGDVHGDYGQYIKVLSAAGLINARGKWTGGATHLVQTGDILDRGPDSRKITDHIEGLKKQAERKGGRVHTLIGNHESMNTYGDLRYVHAGEYQAFAGRSSEEYREKQWEFHLKRMKQVKPEQFLVINLDEYRKEWEKQVPLGWVEHRLAWTPEGEYGQRVLANPVAVMINDTVFLHGGLSPEFCRYSLAELTEMVHERLRNYDPQNTGVLEDNNGPLWYRGLADEDEQSFRPLLEQILARYGAQRIVVGHTPTFGVVWPRFDGHVVINDVGMAAYYGGYNAYLELVEGQAWAGYGEQRLALPDNAVDRIAYLQAVIEMNPENQNLKERLEALLAAQNASADSATEDEPVTEPEPVSPDTCQ